MIKNGEKGTISIVSGNTCVRMCMSDIDLIEQNGLKLRMLTSLGEYVFYDKMEAIAEALIGASFYRAMKSLIVNFDNVVFMKDGTMLFHSGRTYSIGRNNYLMMKRAFKKYLMRYPPFSDCCRYERRRPTGNVSDVSVLEVLEKNNGKKKD